MELDNIRREYNKGNLNERDVKPEPIDQFALWMKDALRFVPDDSTAMILSTVSIKGVPSSRIVLLKDFNAEGFTFFTNYESRKGKELFTNPNASILFYWKELERQIRIEGLISKTDSAISTNYFDSRPMESKVAANASEQSAEIASREGLDEDFEKLKEFYNKEPIVRPLNWGGYILCPKYFEFWQGRENRMHDRICYSLNKKAWEIKRLAP